ncbi:hypothetical protein EI555_002585 [Monodon monoceros]|uniref:40S ribosomal protein S12 n=1 Tax=Monodon monoceros TaxID=40151 RepID=A0A4U1F6A0_MONMO|nr:hypothetical protein EI555_002585 [Monodon monoceros]
MRTVALSLLPRSCTEAEARCAQDSVPPLTHHHGPMAEEGFAAGGVMDVKTALQEVLKTALIQDGLARGIHEAAKALDKRQAHLCVLASNCEEPMYVKLETRGMGRGLCKTDREGKHCKVVGCSWVVVKDYGKESQAKDVIEEYFKRKK